ncbi:putative colanic acid biosynthesis glycosyltransferase [Luteococcus japonicus]|uniref:Putative colanic acid biosynthesis glycosyltransferase n=1 Tax=Luteococcus japonicus TaxID=33984 RepID=A0A3N1ZWK9_9ACTN|nr:glycosyltransferase [Luteococcus japonicus]ROR55241.1 putative colanic acid biosynthesis glycosyltransferase [Luteococcus japonicus]
MSTDRPLLSVLTVTFRDLPGLKATLDSLVPIMDTAGDRVEVLVQDGGTEGVEHVVSDYPWAVLESAPDGGIYDGMNHAIARSRGEFGWFLNGGDVSVIEDFAPIERFLTDNRGALCLFDYELDMGDHNVSRSARDAKYIAHALPTSHQAIMYPADELRREGYDLSFKVTGDYAITARMLAAGMQTATLHRPVARFVTGGTSQQHAKRLAAEAGRVQREILGSPMPLRLASQALHAVSRIRRDRATRTSQG